MKQIWMPVIAIGITLFFVLFVYLVFDTTASLIELLLLYFVILILVEIKFMQWSKK